VAAPDGVALGLDIGGTKVAAVLLDGRGGAVLGRARGPVDPADNDAGLASIFRVVDACLRGAAPDAAARLVGIGAGCPGSIDWRRGVVRGAANLGWSRLPLADALRARYGVPALVDNDVNVAAWGERCFGAGLGAPPAGAVAGAAGGGAAPPDDLVFITVGTGIGAGLVAAGRLLRGRGRTAG